MSRKATYTYGCQDGDCVITFDSKDEAQEHVKTCPRGVLVVQRDGRNTWDEVDDD